MNFFKEAERTWWETMPRPMPSELLSMFPQAKTYLKERKAELLAERAEREAETYSDYRTFLTLSTRFPHLVDAIEGHHVDIPLNLAILRMLVQEAPDWGKAELARIDRYLHKPGKGSITPDDIARAKEHPIGSLVEVIRRDGFVNCPFHGEKTASLKIYLKENRWWCYGSCNSGGDSIDWLMRSEGVEFVDAVRRLSGKQ